MPADEFRYIAREILRTVRDPGCISRTKGTERLEGKARVFTRLDIFQKARGETQLSGIVTIAERAVVVGKAVEPVPDCRHRGRVKRDRVVELRKVRFAVENLLLRRGDCAKRPGIWLHGFASKI